MVVGDSNSKEWMVEKILLIKEELSRPTATFA